MLDKKPDGCWLVAVSLGADLVCKSFTVLNLSSISSGSGRNGELNTPGRCKEHTHVAFLKIIWLIYVTDIVLRHSNCSNGLEKPHLCASVLTFHLFSSCNLITSLLKVSMQNLL